MIRTALWVLGGLVLGGIIHLAVILALPSLTGGVVWSQVAAMGALNKTVVLPAAQAGQPNPLKLDPELSYAVCQIDLRKGPGVVAGTLLTFIPAAGDFINAQLLGSPGQRMVGNVIQSLFTSTQDYAGAGALSVILMALIVGMVMVYIRKVGTEDLV